MKNTLPKTVNERTWYLVNAAMRAAKSPATFEVPDQIKIDAVKIGQHVQLCFGSTIPGRLTEHMWVRVTGFDLPNITGILDSIPAIPVIDLQVSDIITFRKYHIAKTNAS